MQVRRRVLKGKNLPAGVLEVLAREPELAYDVIMRKDTPAHVLAAVYADHDLTDTNHQRLAEHPNTPTHVLEEIERLGAGRSQYTTAHKASVRARARLAERALGESGDLEAAFGELRAALDATPSADAWQMLLRTLRAALAVDPEQVAEVWVPYARERMGAWRASDCALPDAEVDAWIAGARPSPLLGVCKKLSIDARDEEPDEAAWGRLVDSPFTAGLVNLTYLRCPARAALDVLARMDLPAIQEIYAIGFGQEGAPIDHDPVELLSAGWLPRLREFMLSHVRASPSTMTEFVSRTPLLTWLTLNHGALDGAFARALDASGAARQLRHLDLDDGDYAEAVAGLRDLELPALIHLSAGGVRLTQAHLESICASPWLGRLGDLHLDRNPGIVDLSPLIEVVATLRPTVTLRLEGHGAPPDQVEALEAALPETAWLDVG